MEPLALTLLGLGADRSLRAGLTAAGLRMGLEQS